MSTRVRFKGRFAKKKNRDKELKAVAAMCRANAAKRNKSVHNLNDHQPKLAVQGRSTVDVQYISDHPKRIRCEKDIFLIRTVEETRKGSNSILRIPCDECSAITEVLTGKTHITDKNNRHSDVNTKAVLGTVHCDIAETALKKPLNCSNIPTMDSHVYKKFEQKIGPALKTVAKNSYRRAAEEERKLLQRT